MTGISGQVSLFRFTKSENTNSIAVVNIPSMSSKEREAVDEKPGSSVPKEIRRQRKVCRPPASHLPVLVNPSVAASPIFYSSSSLVFIHVGLII